MRKVTHHIDVVSNVEVSFLKTLPVLKELTENQIEHIIAHSKVKNYKKGHLLFFHGDQIEHFYIVLNGWIKLYRETADGKESVVDLLTRGAVFGENGIFNDSLFSFSGEAVDNNVSVVEIPVSVISNLLIKDNKIGLNLIRSLSQRVYQLRAQIESITTMSAAQKVMSFLIKLHNKQDNIIVLPFDKALLANYLGMKPETLSRTLNELRNYGIVVKGSSITIENAKKLEDYTLTNLPDMANINWSMQKTANRP